MSGSETHREPQLALFESGTTLKFPSATWMIAGAFVLLLMLAFVVFLAIGFERVIQPANWQEVRVNGVTVYVPDTNDWKKFNTTATAVGDSELEFVWRHESGAFELIRNHVYYDGKYFGTCKPDGTVRIYPDGSVKIDGEFREPRSDE